MSNELKIQCATHGWQEEAFVCQHIAESLQTGVPVGFHWPPDSTNSHPDAWCDACEQSRIDAGGDWTLEAEKLLNIKLLCGACYDFAKSIWKNGQKETH
jgi:hypothetical protein